MAQGKQLLIAEVGNNHFGDFELARTYVRAALEHGAHAVKFQAFDPGGIYGSMPRQFYEECALSREQYAELVFYGSEIGIPVFFSTWGERMQRLEVLCSRWKLAASQEERADLKHYDCEKTIVSVSQGAITAPTRWKRAQMLMATPYMARTADFEKLLRWSEHMGRMWGLSCHCLGPATAIRAVREYSVPIVEKHFTLMRSVKWQHWIFRDTVHAALPGELEQIRNAMEGMKWN